MKESKEEITNLIRLLNTANFFQMLTLVAGCSNYFVAHIDQFATVEQNIEIN